MLLLGFILIACQKAPAPKTEPLQKITVSFTYQPQGTLVHIAIAKGYFIEEGLDVQPQMYTYGKAALQALLDHKADIATAAETPIMFSILNQEKIFIIANILASNTNNAIVARRDAGINSPQDLKGKRIGYTPGTTSDFFFSSLLTAKGIERKDVQEVSLKPEEMSDAMLSQKVDAVSTWNYQLTQISHELGDNGLVIYDKEIYTETYNIASQQEFVQRNPTTIQCFLRALIKAENFVQDHPDEAQTIMSNATLVDKSLVQEVWDRFTFHVALNETLLITLEDETRWAINHHLTDQTQMPNYLSYLYFDGLNAVRPEAVRIWR